MFQFQGPLCVALKSRLPLTKSNSNLQVTNNMSADRTNRNGKKY